MSGTAVLSEADERAIDAVAAMLRPGQRLLFITGAGISADSGLPTYRGVGGLYGDERTTRHGYSIEQVLSGPMMALRPEIPWSYLIELEQACRGVAPNRGHEVIAAMEDHFAAVWTLTQNVDGLHRRAGSSHLIEIHGNLHTLLCTGCGDREEVDDFSHLAVPPRCLLCRAIIRPDVVLFGEELPAGKLATLRREWQQGFDLVVSVGTTSLFPYIAEPVLRARAVGIPTVEINPGRSAVSEDVDFRIATGAAVALDALWSRYLAGHLLKRGQEPF